MGKQKKSSSLRNDWRIILVSIAAVVLTAAVMQFLINRITDIYDQVDDLDDSNDQTSQSIDSSNIPDGVPSRLASSFPETDFNNSSVDWSEVVSGGPGKDGIPALSSPKFEPISDSSIRDEVQALVYVGESETRVYPYNILNWHEIVNDEIDGVPIAVTFCPLCGSAIVFNRTTTAGVAEFGVSGFLRESNMIMYDRITESLWQQSVGQALAGQLNQERLEFEPFQLLTIAEAKGKYPDAQILREDTGHSRDYDRNPYSGYEDSDRFFFAPSVRDERYPDKEIFVIYNFNGYSFATPNSSLVDGEVYNFSGEGFGGTIEKRDGEIFVKDGSGERVAHYFEMWFSWAVQHQDGEADVIAEVFDPAKEG